MKVLLVYLGPSEFNPINHGIAALAAALRNEGHLCELAYLQIEDDFENCTIRLNSKLQSYSPDLICFSVNSYQYLKSLQIAKSIKGTIPIIVGGVHCILNAETVISEEVWDFVCTSEGEESLVKLVSALAHKDSFRDIPNIASKLSTESKTRYLVNLSDYNDIDYSVFDINVYLDNNNNWMRVMATRGCPNKCSYCFNSSMSKIIPSMSFIRYYDPSVIIAKIKQLIENHTSIRMLNFDDDIFTADTNFLYKFTKLYKESRIDIPYAINSHVNFFDNEIAKALSDSGCKIVRFGVESGSKRIREKILNRRMSNTEIIMCFRAAEKAGLYTQGFFMLGIPTETSEDIRKTIELCGSLNLDRFRWSYLYPYPGTPIYDYAIRTKLINKEKFSSSNNFFEGTPFEFEPDHDLMLKKLGHVFSWYINALPSSPSSEQYSELLRWVESLNAHEWEIWKHKIKSIDDETSKLNGETPHYKMEFTQNLGVCSTFIKQENHAAFSATSKCAR